MLEKYLVKRRLRKGFEIEDAVFDMGENSETLVESPIERQTVNFVWYSTIVLLIFLTGRVFYLDVIRGAYYAEVSRDNRIRSLAIKAPRGNILDKFGKVIARNVPSLDAVIVPYYLPEEDGKKAELAKNISEILEMNDGNAEAIIQNQKKGSLEEVLLKENITQEQSLIISERQQDLPGIFIDKTAIRSYENGMIFSHIIGYDGKITREEMEGNKGYLMTDYIGKAGLEKNYESELRGKFGERQVEIDSLGNVKKDLGAISPQAGNDLVLNIDEGLQKKIYDSLMDVLSETETKTAAAVAIDPRTGGVLAMVSLPGFDNNSFARGISNDEYRGLVLDKNLPLLNRAIAGEYPPGSTVKPAIAAAALSEGIIIPSTIIDGLGGRLYLGNFSFGDWKVHGPSDVRRAIAESNDIFFYTIGGGYGNIGGLGMDRMKKYYNFFGFGENSGIDLGGESSGLIPDEEWKQRKLGEKWYVGNSYHAAIGQGFISATPLQLANYTVAVANGGTIYRPHIVSRIKESGEQDRIITPEIIRRNFVSGDILKIVREGMRQTITSGTAQSLKDLPVEVAGKTGTAQFGSENKTHAWFVSFAPYADPQVAMVVLVEGGGEGHSSAVPVTKDVYDWYFGENRQ
jgi:penicillin-binding protein 2